MKYDFHTHFFLFLLVVDVQNLKICISVLNIRGVAVQVTDNLSGCPTLSEINFPLGFVLLQNLPSIICGHVLNPKPGDVVLDMCAAPGNKTSHLAALMKNNVSLYLYQR